ncbi:MAG: SMP-30/gluconolactonase/LRE family protein [Propionibacteriaceae bacterium]|nr:SMP-30/gluconolactonase/LRE family protein [Propionibacteriaceae bacterium]
MTTLWDAEAGVARLATGGTWLEGPAWTPWGLLVSDIPANRILRWDRQDGFEVFAEDAEFSNGRTVGPDGRVYQCSHGRRAVEELHADGSVTPVVDRYGQARLNSPNDLVVGLDGAIWFTDPPYGIIQAHEGHPGEREYHDHYVFRFDPSTGELRAVVTDVEEPNGLAFAPDGRTLYVADTSAALHPEGLGNRHIRAYDVVEGRACKNGRVFAVMTEGLADGFRVDAEGRVWTSHGSNVTVIAPDGTWLETIPMPELVGNLCFGGQDGTQLFVAASTSVYRIQTFTSAATPWSSR